MKWTFNRYSYGRWRTASFWKCKISLVELMSFGNILIYICCHSPLRWSKVEIPWMLCALLWQLSYSARKGGGECNDIILCSKRSRVYSYRSCAMLINLFLLFFMTIFLVHPINVIPLFILLNVDCTHSSLEYFRYHDISFISI